MRKKFSDIPENLKDVVEFFSKCDTKRMRKLRNKFVDSDNTESKMRIVEEMYREFLKNNVASADKCVTYEMLCRKLTSFHSIDFAAKETLLVGKIQAGKSAYIFGIALMQLKKDKPCILVVRNFTQDAIHMMEKANRFRSEHIEAVGNADKTLETVYAGEMTCVMKNKGLPSQSITVGNYKNVLDALTVNKKLIIVLANGHQLMSVNKIIQDHNIEDVVVFTDEADSIGYSFEEPEYVTRYHKSREYNMLKERAVQSYEISATVWDVFIGNKELLNTNIVVVNPPSSYHGILNVQYIKLEQKINMIKFERIGCLVKEDPNFTEIYDELSLQRPYSPEQYNCNYSHPVIIIHKTKTQVLHHDEFFNYFRKKYTDWVVIKEYGQGIVFFSNKLIGETIEINHTRVSDRARTGVFSFERTIIIPQLLQWLFDNGGAERFGHIVIKSGRLSGRSRSYVSTNGEWHLTHQYYIGAKTVPALLQEQRILHDRPDAIPLTTYAPWKDIKNIKKGELIQEEQIDRILNYSACIKTSDKVKSEIWTIDKIPRAKLCIGEKNSSFEPIGVTGRDGGMSIDLYNNEIYTDPVYHKISHAVPPGISRKIYQETLNSAMNIGMNTWHSAKKIVLDIYENGETNMTKEEITEQEFLLYDTYHDTDILSNGLFMKIENNELFVYAN